MLSHNYSYQECLDNSKKVAWKEDGCILNSMSARLVSSDYLVRPRQHVGRNCHADLLRRL